MSTFGVIRHRNQTIPNAARSEIRCEGLRYLGERPRPYDWTIPVTFRLSNWGYYFSVFNFWLYRRWSYDTMPLKSHQTRRFTFCFRTDFLFSLHIVGNKSFFIDCIRSSHDWFILLRLGSESQIVKRSIKLFLLNRDKPNIISIQCAFKRSSKLIWNMWSTFAMPYVVWVWLLFLLLIIMSVSIMNDNCRPSGTFSAFHIKIHTYKPSELLKNTFSYGTFSINGTYIFLLIAQRRFPFQIQEHQIRICISFFSLHF